MTLTLNEYQKRALVTDKKNQELKDRLADKALGLAGEAGEAADHIKKHLFHGHDLDKAKLTGEIGDVLWYVAVLSAALEIDLEDVARMNLDKLRRRYGGEFTVEKSVNRLQD